MACACENACKKCKHWTPTGASSGANRELGICAYWTARPGISPNWTKLGQAYPGANGEMVTSSDTRCTQYEAGV